ncbi:MAG: SDR family oxidoreductase [Phycisphaerales bacterium]|nr:SDR family oxidoreductase [Phycisphaerales bacterium]
MRVLVTGHKGYIGTVLVPMLLEAGHEVIGFDSDLYWRSTFGDPAAIADVPEIAKDIRDATLADVRGVDAVMHLAGLSNDPLGDLNPELTFDINHRASVKLAQLAKEAGVGRFIFSSSCSNYGAAGDNWINENSTLNPVTPYGQSKVMVERDVVPMADASFSPTFLRNATAFGVSPRLRFDLVLNNLAAWALTTGKIMLKSDGSPWRPIVHVEDIARAFVATMEAPRELVHGQVFNVAATAENYQVRQLALIVGDTVQDSQVTFADGASPDLRNYRVNCDRYAATFPTFRPQWTAPQTAQELLHAYRSVGLLLADFEGPRYRRVDHIRQLMATGVLDATLRPCPVPRG